MKLLIVSVMLTTLLLACSSESATNKPSEPSEPTIASSGEIEGNEKSEEKEVTEQTDLTEQTTESVDSSLQSPKSDFDSVIPTGWTLLNPSGESSSLAEGDLNDDGLQDVAMVIEVQSTQVEFPKRALLIAFGNEDKTYTLSTMAESAVLRKDQGGAWGDPFKSMVIDRGSVVLKHYGGSNWRWYHSYRFRYQDNDWYLIGATEGSYFTGTQTPENADEEDYNLLTGDYVIRKTDEEGNMTTSHGNRGRKELIRLENFDISLDEKQY